MIKNYHFHYAFFFILLVLISCNRTLDWGDYYEYLYDPSKGLSQELRANQDVFTVTYWPKDLVAAKGLSRDEMFFFELVTDDTQVLFTKSEINFKLLAGGIEIPASIVFAENAGWSNRNRLLVGFTPINRQDMQLMYISDEGETLASINFDQSDLEQIPNLKINR